MCPSAAGRGKTLLVPGKTYGYRGVAPDVAVGRRAAAGIALLVAGLLLVGAGAAGYVQGQQCRLTQEVAVGHAPNATAGDDTRVTPFANLSASEQRVFVDTLEARAPVLAKRGAIDAGLVRYENRTYRVTVHRRSDCTPADALSVRGPVAGGLVALVAGVALARGRRP